MQFTISHPGELDFLAVKLLAYAGNRRKMLFRGDLGAGKTTFIQAICRQLGVTEAVSSPTFAIVNEYEYPREEGEAGCIHHIDLYRLKGLEEALEIGIEEYLYDSCYCFIEWPDVISPLLPEDCVEISLWITDESERKIVFL
jgi:tRNA threonylcarbamoyladenosine biosynthesis protein TsaE